MCLCEFEAQVITIKSLSKMYCLTYMTISSRVTPGFKVTERAQKVTPTGNQRAHWPQDLYTETLSTRSNPLRVLPISLLLGFLGVRRTRRATLTSSSALKKEVNKICLHFKCPWGHKDNWRNLSKVFGSANGSWMNLRERTVQPVSVVSVRHHL